MLFSLLVGSCGLPTPSMLPTPFGPLVGVTPGVLSFQGSASGYPVMLGYEIYYKLIGITESTPDVLHHDELRADFGRIFPIGGCDSEDIVFPLVNVTNADSPHTVSLDFTFSSETDSEPNLGFSWSGELTTIRRSVSDDLGFCRRFSTTDGYEGNSNDITAGAVLAIAEGSLIDLVVYVVSYGRDKGTDIYGAPLLVGRLRLDDLPYG